MKEPPVSMISPVGGEPLFEEPGSGLRLTACDYAARHGFSSANEVLKAYRESLQEPIEKPTSVEEDVAHD